MATKEELEALLSEIEGEMLSEKSIKVDEKITVNKRSVSELSTLYSLTKDKLDRLDGVKNNCARARRGGFE